MSGYFSEVISRPSFIVISAIALVAVIISGIICVLLWYKDRISGTIAIVSFIGSIVLIIFVLIIALLIFNYFSGRNFTKRLSDDIRVERMDAALRKQMEDEDGLKQDLDDLDQTSRNSRTRKESEDFIKMAERARLENMTKRLEFLERRNDQMIQTEIMNEMRKYTVWSILSDDEIKHEIHRLDLMKILKEENMEAVKGKISTESKLRLEIYEKVCKALNEQKKQQEEVERILEQHL